ncbi:MAG: hypothetical protein J6K58_07695 [Lachnospiraceae bacterium]|nr:hypothetical protein [Lachnospiraceae bacterium]
MEKGWRAANEQDREVIVKGEKAFMQRMIKYISIGGIVIGIAFFLIMSCIHAAEQEKKVEKILRNSSSSLIGSYYPDNLYDYTYILDDKKADENKRERTREQVREQLRTSHMTHYAVGFGIIGLIYITIMLGLKIRYQRYKNENILVCNAKCIGKERLSSQEYKWKQAERIRNGQDLMSGQLCGFCILKLLLEDETTREMVVSVHLYDDAGIDMNMLVTRFENRMVSGGIESIYVV